ncbi:hypothetical protein OG252_20695 [Streptomyces sp. NBC_01352]|uniref:Uncharacterized protein n=1 Tax=Streptomyces plumbiresistens TaxID=511811 RepID=A0ABP7PYL0_9ACTN|nr:MULTISPECIES: hypothetical protein [unclassified Streptomyces]MCX4698400.1 hypothetical protein [Streptomyces sp. NBC_01373]
MVPGVKVFFAEVRETCAGVAERLGLEGPGERESGLPVAVATYTGSGVKYEVVLGLWDGYVEIHACRETSSTLCKVSVEKLAVAAGAVEKPGGVSFSARSLRQMRKSLAGQLRYVELVHPLVTEDAAAAVELMRRADAREWSKPLPK